MNYRGKDLAMYFYKSGSKGGLVGITEVDSINGKYFLTNGFMGVYLIEEEVENFINKWNSYSSRTTIPLETFKKEKNIYLEHELISSKKLSDEILLSDIPANRVTLTPFVDQSGSRVVLTEDFIIIADNDAVEFVKSAGVDLITAAAYSALYFFKNEEILGFVMPKTMKGKDKERLNKIINSLYGKDIINVEKTA